MLKQTVERTAEDYFNLLKKILPPAKIKLKTDSSIDVDEFNCQHIGSDEFKVEWDQNIRYFTNYRETVLFLKKMLLGL